MIKTLENKRFLLIFTKKKHKIMRAATEIGVSVAALTTTTQLEAEHAMAAHDSSTFNPRRTVDGKRSPELTAWYHMVDRCYNPKSQRYDCYGARGIVVCERWRGSFEAFFEDMGTRPSDNHSIERKNNNGNYEQGNCIWATKEVQNRNRSDNVILEFDGKRMTIAEWARETGIHTKTLNLRIKAGWAVQDALTRPTEQRRWDGDESPPRQKVSWKRKPKPRKLTPLASSLLAKMIALDWVTSISLNEGDSNCHYCALKLLVSLALVESRTFGVGRIKPRYEYRITDPGRGEVYEAIRRDENRHRQEGR